MRAGDFLLRRGLGTDVGDSKEWDENALAKQLKTNLFGYFKNTRFYPNYGPENIIIFLAADLSDSIP